MSAGNVNTNLSVQSSPEPFPDSLSSSLEINGVFTVNGSDYSDVISETNKRLDLLESNIKALPAIIAETIISAFNSASMPLPVPVFTPAPNYTPPSGVAAGQNIYVPGSCGITTGMGVDISPALLTLTSMVTQQLSASINYDELNKLRNRIKELEEDMGYREKVATELMKDFK